MTPNLPRVRIGLPTLCLAFLRVFTLIAMFGGPALAMGAGSGQAAAARGSDASDEPRTGYKDATAIPSPRLPEEIRSREDRINGGPHRNADARKNASLARA
jgi:hypothetical protein